MAVKVKCAESNHF